jgi:hypothetical protein
MRFALGNDSFIRHLDRLVDITSSLSSIEIDLTNSETFPKSVAALERFAAASHPVTEARITWDAHNSAPKFTKMIEGLAPMLSRLEHLTISWCDENMNQILDIIATSSPHLQILEIRNRNNFNSWTPRVTPLVDAKSALSKFTRLEKLVLPRMFDEIHACDNAFGQMEEQQFTQAKLDTFKKSFDALCEIFPPQLRSSSGVFCALHDSSGEIPVMTLLGSILVDREQSPHCDYLLQRIIDLGIVNSQDRSGWSLLAHVVAQSENEWIVSRLLGAGADPFAPFSFRNKLLEAKEGTVLHNAIGSRFGGTLIAEVTSRYDAQTLADKLHHLRSPGGYSPLHVSSASFPVWIDGYNLLEPFWPDVGADANNRKCQTPLHSIHAAGTSANQYAVLAISRFLLWKHPELVKLVQSSCKPFPSLLASVLLYWNACEPDLENISQIRELVGLIFDETVGALAAPPSTAQDYGFQESEGGNALVVALNLFPDDPRWRHMYHIIAKDATEHHIDRSLLRVCREKWAAQTLQSRLHQRDAIETILLSRPQRKSLQSFFTPLRTYVEYNHPISRNPSPANRVQLPESWDAYLGTIMLFLDRASKDCPPLLNRGTTLHLPESLLHDAAEFARVADLVRLLEMLKQLESIQMMAKYLIRHQNSLSVSKAFLVENAWIQFGSCAVLRDLWVSIASVPNTVLSMEAKIILKNVDAGMVHYKEHTSHLFELIRSSGRVCDFLDALE